MVSKNVEEDFLQVGDSVICAGAGISSIEPQIHLKANMV